MELFDFRELADLVKKQLNLFWCVEEDLYSYQQDVHSRVLTCFSGLKNKYFSDGSNIMFSPYNSVQYTIYLYFLAHVIYRAGNNNQLCDKIYYLNKMINSVDWFYAVELPEVFCCEHPLGSVLGRAKYGNHFFFYQGCTVGGNKGNYPSIGEHVVMCSNSAILGNCKIGDFVVISSGVTIIDQNIPDNSLVFGNSPNIVIKTKSEQYVIEKQRQFWM